MPGLIAFGFSNSLFGLTKGELLPEHGGFIAHLLNHNLQDKFKMQQKTVLNILLSAFDDLTEVGTIIAVSSFVSTAA